MKSNVFFLALSLCILIFGASCSVDNQNEVSAADTPDASTTTIPDAPLSFVERGGYLVLTSGCADCHSPKKMTEMGPVVDMDRYMMGFPADQPRPEFKQSDIPQGWILMNMDQTAAVGPWGVSYAANLTPDESGIGNWSYENFKRALVEGKYRGQETGRILMPPMPWQNIGQMKDEDMQAMFAYLQSLKPIENVVPAYTPPVQ